MRPVSRLFRPVSRFWWIIIIFNKVLLFLLSGFNFQVQVPHAGHVVLRRHDRHILHHQPGEDGAVEEWPHCARAVS